MDLTAVGPVTTVIESTAAAVGASMLLGGFGTGIYGVVLGWPRPALEARVLEGGYIGGGAGVVGIIADIIIRYLI
jgi:hypothetical protein